MVFSTHIFLFYFLPIVLLAYYALPRHRNAFLTIASYVFYGWWEPWFVLLMMFSTVLDYVCGGIIGAPAASPARRRAALLAAICGDLGLLAFFKYYTFTAENVNRLLELFGSGSLPLLHVVLPIGISFYTFESMSYTIDVYRGVVKPARTFSDLSCFVSLFPHLVAGPIVRYNILAEQIAHREHTLEKFTCGIALFMLGFAKKILLANPMGSVADAAFGASGPLPLDAWVGVMAYAFQIYFDFSGYSDMAIGLGRMFGFVIPKNFASPYLSQGITEFWRRWHISLSTWLRDYLYLSLGGNRKGARRTYLNLALVMLLGGLWHGANWTFVAWGAYHGGLLAFERWMGKKTAYEWLPRPARVAMTFVLVLFSWVLFRAQTMGQAVAYLGAMFGARPASAGAALLAAELYTPYHLAILVVCILVCFQPLEVYDWVEDLTWQKMAAVAPLFLFAVGAMFTQTFN
ncbi:MAG TPA: MBOAT family O-acyltransferase, partial [Bryobacteraceae bacterium]|nr:MBOAT family O-acyltransferase [Bryobacteraceae bacterium]